MSLVDYAVVQNLQFLVGEIRETNRLLRKIAGEPVPEPPPPAEEKQRRRWLQ